MGSRKDTISAHILFMANYPLDLRGVFPKTIFQNLFYSWRNYLLSTQLLSFIFSTQRLTMLFYVKVTLFVCFCDSVISKLQ